MCAKRRDANVLLLRDFGDAFRKTMAASHNGQSSSTALIRTIGRWSLTALVINSIIGSGIFGLPSPVSVFGSRRRFGARRLISSPAFAGMAIVAGCLAEVASQFHETGGPYLYARETLGRFWGIQDSAWMMWLSRIAAARAVWTCCEPFH